MLLTLKDECVSIIADHITVVIEGTVVMLDFYLKLKFEGGDFTSACKGDCNASYFGHMGLNMKMIDFNDTVH